MSKWMKFAAVGWVLIFSLAACFPGNGPSSDSSESTAPDKQDSKRSGRDYSQLEIVTLLPRDGIPAIDDPQFLSVSEADSEYAPDELVIGVNYNGDARAYSIPFLSSHEIVNDTVGGKKIAVTW